MKNFFKERNCLKRVKKKKVKFILNIVLKKESPYFLKSSKWFLKRKCSSQKIKKKESKLKFLCCPIYSSIFVF